MRTTDPQPTETGITRHGVSGQSAATGLTIESRPLLAAWPRATSAQHPSTALPLLDAGGAAVLAPEDAAELASGGGGDQIVDRPTTVLPYTRQDDYDRDPIEHPTTVAVLQNEHLRAEFLLELGGRLWSLRDLATDTELLHQPHALQPGNLALRNAWFAGGVEWNLGFTGHWALTCEPVHAARLTAPDGTPVLRLWEYERMLGITWRIDVWLPADSRVLLVRPVLENPTDTTIPVYWWSNIAAPQTAESRVIAPADHAWQFGYSDRLKYLPFGDELSRPADAGHSADYFFDVRPDDRALPWICSVDRTGRGLLQCSTARLRGRKLFVWGEGAGGRRWQEWLGGGRSYLEIQAGLARTQLEHLPMGPGQCWAWTEAYGPVDAPEAATAEWGHAVDAARAAVHADAEPWLSHGEHVLSALAGAAPDEVVHTASGWGALEVAAGHRAADPATPCPESSLGAEQRPWLDLVEGAELTTLEAAPVLGRRWTERLRAAAPGPARDYHLGLAAHAGGDTDTAVEHWRRANSAGDHPLALRALAWSAAQRGELDAAVENYAAAVALAPGHAQLAVEALTTMCRAGRFEEAAQALTLLPDAVLDLGRVQYLRCRISLARGDLDTVRTLLVERVLVVPDLREGEDSLDALWTDYCRATGQELALPAHYDFRMHPDEASRT